MKKIIFLILILSIITASVFISVSAADPEYNCPVYIYDAEEGRFFGYGYLKFQGDHYDSIIRLYGRNDGELTVDFSAPSTTGSDYYFNELDLNDIDGTNVYGINFVSGPDANNLSTLPIIPSHNVTYSNGVIYSTYWDWRDYSLGMCIVVYLTTTGDAYIPPFNYDDIQSGFNEVVSGFEDINQGMVVETIPAEEFELHFSGGFGSVDRSSDINILSDILSHNIVLPIIIALVSFAGVSLVLFGKKE